VAAVAKQHAQEDSFSYHLNLGQLQFLVFFINNTCKKTSAFNREMINLN